MSTSPGDATRLLVELGNGDAGAAEQLLPLVYDELRRLAGGYFRRERNDHTLQPTALVHEAYLRLIQQATPGWNDRAHFLAVAARAMRNILVNHAVAARAAKRGGGQPTLVLDADVAPTPTRTVDTLDLDAALVKLSDLDSRKAQVVELRFFGGLTVDETAAVLDVSVSTIEADWRMAKAWLSKELSA